MQDALINAGLSKDDTEKLAVSVNKILNSDILCSEKWRKISKELLTPKIPFAVHEYLFAKTYEKSDEPHYIWIPSEKEISKTNLSKYMKSQNISDLSELLKWADLNREEFWQSMVSTLGLKFDNNNNNNNKVFDLSKGVEHAVYFPNQKMNAADWILTGDDNRDAIVWSKEGINDNLGNPILNKITLRELKQSATNIAYSLTNKLSLSPGDAIGIDMPMNWQSVAIYLGIIKAGMVVVSIADSFAPNAIEIRLKIANAKLVFTQDVIARGIKKIPLYNRVVEANALKCIVLAESDDNNFQCNTILRDNDMSWNDFLSGTNNNTIFKSISCDSMDVANILFSSGTTGAPKAIPWHHSTFIKPFTDGYLHNDIQSSEVVAWPTNIGWMMGPWLISQIGLNSCIALFVGSPVGSSFCKFVEISNISHLGVIPSIVKAWMRLNAISNCSWSCVRRYSSTGEASNPTLYHWLVSRANYAPVMEYVGGTEIAGGYLCGTMVQPQILSSFSCPAIGLNIHLIDVEGKILNNHQLNIEGELAISPPSCGLSVTLLNKDHDQVYYSGMPSNIVDINNNNMIRSILRRHGDTLRVVAISANNDIYYQHLGRVDDTMNLGGIKISSVALENVILKHPLLSREVAAISYRENDIDQEQLVICCVPKSKNDLFSIQFNKKPFGLKLAPIKNNNKITVVYSADSVENKENENYLSKQPIIYRINDRVIYNKINFDDMLQIIKNAKINSDNPMTIYFLQQRFNTQNVTKEVAILIKKELNPLFKVSDLYLIDKLPRTASGKVMRRILRKNYSDSQHVDK